MRKDTDDLKYNESFKQIFGELYKNTRVDTYCQRMFYMLFLLKRIIYIGVALIWPEMPFFFQFMILISLNYATVIYYSYSKPHQQHLERKFELFNEFMVGQSYFLFLTQTDWVEDPQIKFNYSWLIQGIIEIMIIINMAYISKLTYYAFKINYYYLKKKFHNTSFYRVNFKPKKPDVSESSSSSSHSQLDNQSSSAINQSMASPSKSQQPNAEQPNTQFSAEFSFGQLPLDDAPSERIK